MTKIDLHPVRNNPDLPDYFKQHIQKRIDEHGGTYGFAWKLIRRFRDGKYCLARLSGGRLCLFSAKEPGTGPRSRCGWHGGAGNSGPKTAEGKNRIATAQQSRRANFRLAKTSNK